jgi:hypothetical protein
MSMAARVRDEHARLRGGRARQGPSPKVHHRRAGPFVPHMLIFFNR